MSGTIATAAEDLRSATDKAVRTAIETPQISGAWIFKPQFAVSPDRREVAFVVEQADVAANSITTALWIQALTGKDAPRMLARISSKQADGADIPRSHSTVPDTTANPSYSPDGTRIAIIGADGELELVDAHTGAMQALTPRPSQLWEAGKSQRFQDAAWSPRDPLIAVSFMETQNSDPNKGVLVSPDWPGRALGQQVVRMAVIDVRTADVIAVTPPNLDVTGMTTRFSWSPDGSKIAFSARRTSDGTYDDGWTDVFVLDVKNRAIEPLIVQDGRDSDPQWSPDGRTIAFLTENGVPMWKRPTNTRVRSSLGLYDLQSRTTKLVALSDATTNSPYAVSWYDGDHLTFIGGRRMGYPLFMATMSSGTIQQLSPDDLSSFGAALPGPSGTVLTVSHTFEHPGVLVTSSVKHWSPKPIGPTSAQSLPAADARTVSWKSGRFEVHGVLLTPRDSRSGRRPLLVSVVGGPSMVAVDDYNSDAQQLIYPALLRGYAVFLPNTRGRGGYGREFGDAIAAEQDEMQGPLSDVMTGVNYLVDEIGVADRDRMALVGFSFGGALASFTASHTHDFKAIIAAEGAVDPVAHAAQVYGSMQQIGLDHLVGAANNPYDPHDRAILEARSPIRTVSNVRTPVLIECGILSMAGTDCLKFFRGVRLTGTPADLIVYPRTGHGISEPALRYDGALNEAAWLDRWIR